MNIHQLENKTDNHIWLVGIMHSSGVLLSCSLKIVLIQCTRKYVERAGSVPHCGHTLPPGSMIWTKLNLLHIRKLSSKFLPFWFKGSWEEHFKDWPYIFACKNFDSLMWSQPRGSWFKQTCIFTISGSFHINFSFSGPVVLEKIFKWNHPIFA